MRNPRRRFAGLAAAALVASLCFATSAEAARRGGTRTAATAGARTVVEIGDTASESWMSRTIHWLQAFFGADNGEVVPYPKR